MSPGNSWQIGRAALPIFELIAHLLEVHPIGPLCRLGSSDTEALPDDQAVMVLNPVELDAFAAAIL